MSCKACEAAQENVTEVTYLRVGNANVMLIGCREHLGQLITELRDARGTEVSSD